MAITRDYITLKNTGLGSIDTSHLEGLISDLNVRINNIENNTNNYDDTIIVNEINNIKENLNNLSSSLDILNNLSDDSDDSIHVRIDALNTSLAEADKNIQDIHDNRVIYINNKINEIENILNSLEDNDLLLINNKIQELELSIHNILSNGYDDTELKNRVTNLEQKVDNDTIYDDTQIKQDITELKNRVDNDTIYDDSEVKQRLSILESKEDKDTVYDDTEIKNKINQIQNNMGNVTVYNDDIEFLSSQNIFGYISDNGLGVPCLAYSMNGRAYDYKTNHKLGIDVGINAVAKLTLVYKEDGKEDEIKSFVPIARSEVLGTTLVPSTTGNIFWAEWLNASDNQGNYIICSIDGTLKLCQWVGTHASSIDELFTKITAGGDVSEDISIVHKLMVNDDNFRNIDYGNGDIYRIIKNGEYSYRVNNADNTAQTNFTMQFIYTGLIEKSNIIGDGYLDDKILSAIEEINNTDSKISFSLSGYLHSNPTSSGSSSTYGLRPIYQGYIDMGDNNYTSFRNKGGVSSFQVRSTIDAPEYIKNMAIWASIPSKDNFSLDENDIILAPVKYNSRFYLVLFTGIPSSNILEQLESGLIAHSYGDYKKNKLILSEIPSSGEYGYLNRNKYDGTTIVISMGYANELKKIKCPFKGSHGIPQLKSSTMPDLANQLGSETYLFQNDSNFLKDGIRWGSYSAYYYNEFKMPYPSTDSLYK